MQYRLIVRDIKTLQIVHLFTNMDTVQYMEVRMGGLVLVDKKSTLFWVKSKKLSVAMFTAKLTGLLCNTELCRELINGLQFVTRF